ncbi:MAG: T9SS type A sorting domain-containing protein [Bacteroidetes bacterium]|nr:T9SS type A sorting domain-containing protein [Bacteroidota bacterium]
MKKIFFFFVLTIPLCAQPKLSHTLHVGNIPARKALISDTLRILAILVQFAEDNDSRSSGNGMFDLSSTAQKYIDAPPHDSAYFSDHFLFAQNYFRKVSNGKQTLRATVLGKVLTLSKQMKEYAPLNGNHPLTAMIEEAWLLADSVYNGFPFQEYDLFVLSHAGSGKDIDLRGTLGYDPTPYDIPSLYFNLSAFQKVLGNTFTGIPLKNSSFKIPNTVVLPETENRILPTGSGDYQLKLSLNGLLVANIASHLGLPDLFDTKTGRTAIGRFGLMDGQAIFSYGGICPPEPNAWEKAHLGWTTPIEIYGAHNYSLPAAGLYQTGEDTVYKVPISAKEYFLVENRFRDTKYDGQTFTMRWNGQTITKTIYTDDKINNKTIDSLFGVIIDVDEPDWSLPGYKDSLNSYQGGILIWHIDESVIEKKIALNEINADPHLRGVDLEEADGSQDIGKTYEFGQPGGGSEDGTLFDYWYSRNTAPMFKNEFSETTTPNSLSNSFAHSHVVIKNFSVDSSIGAFRAEIGTPDIQLLNVIKRTNIKVDNNDAPLAVDINRDGREELIYTSGDSIYILKNDGTPYLNNSTGLFSSFGGKSQPVIVDSAQHSTNIFLAGIDSNTLTLFSLFDANNNGIADTITTIRNISPSSPLFSQKSSSSLNPILSWGSMDGKVFSYDVSAKNLQSFAVAHSPVLGFVFGKIISVDKLYDTDGSVIVSFSSSAESFAGFNDNGNAGSVQKIAVKFSNNDIGIIDVAAKSIKYFNTSKAVGSLSIADIDGDGSADILAGGSDGLYGFNQNGIQLEYFPLRTKDGGSVLGSPALVRLNGTNEIAIIFGSTNGQLSAYTSKGKMISGFPLQTGGLVSSPVIWGNKLAAASLDTSLYVWNTDSLFDTSKIIWNNFLADNYHSNFITLSGIGIKKSSELLPKTYAYNWPNPAYGSTTNIRYFLGKPAIVKIRILNLAGELVDEFAGTGYGAIDNEVVWNLAKVQSGIYFAEISASGGGESQRQIIKIAVVK